MRILRIFQLLFQYLRAQRSFAYAAQHNLIGVEFGRFGKKVGWQLLSRGEFLGIRFVLVPVISTRYFEFAFVKEALPAHSRYCLDVSSPALFSLFMANRCPEMIITMINPNSQDISQTNKIVEKLDIPNIYTSVKALHELKPPNEGYDCIWSISVLEHISGAYDDSQSMRMLYAVLKSGGRLIITVPVDRRFWIEYRNQDSYGTQPIEKDGYFFARFYDLDAIWERLLSPIECEPTQIRWFGERVKGHFHEYIRCWMNYGLDCIVDDPREIIDHYEEFERWQDMPGVGVCGLVIDKP